MTKITHLLIFPPLETAKPLCDVLHGSHRMKSELDAAPRCRTPQYWATWSLAYHLGVMSFTRNLSSTIEQV